MAKLRLNGRLIYHHVCSLLLMADVCVEVIMKEMEKMKQPQTAMECLSKPGWELLPLCAY